MMKILVTGSSGFIGQNLVSTLCQHGYDVAGCDLLPNKSSSRPRRSAVIDLLDLSALQEFIRVEQPEVLFHLGARTDLLGRSPQDYAANTTGVENIIATCSQVPSIRRVIFASSRLVCRIDHIPASYNDYCPPNAYGESKVEGELVVKRGSHPYEWVIVRPTSIWGPGFGIPYRSFFDQVRKRRYVHPANYFPRKSFGFVGNTVFQLERLILAERSQIHERTFYLGDYDALEVTNWAEYIHRAFGLAGKIKTVPMPILRLAARAGDFLNFALGKDLAPLNTFRLKNLVTDMVYPQLEELHDVTGPLPFDWRLGTDLTVRWLLGCRGR